MTSAFWLGLIVLSGVILERSILPMVSLAGATLSPLAIAVGSLSLLGWLEPALVSAIFGGMLLDFLAPQPFGFHTVVLLVVWGVNFSASRYRLFTGQLVVVAGAMTLVGTIVALPQFLATFDFLFLIASALLHAIVGTFLFPVFRKLFPKEEVIRLGEIG